MSPANDPRIDLRVIARHLQFDPGNLLVCEYDIEDSLFDHLQTLETSVLWYTEGKGDEDIGVHFFVRRTREQLKEDRLSSYRFETTLPLSPLTYDGEIVKIRWCVRVRLFWGRGKETVVDRVFQLLPRPSVGRTATTE